MSVEGHISYSKVNYCYENREKQNNKEETVKEVWKIQTVPNVEFLELIEDRGYHLSINEYCETYYDTDDCALMKKHNLWIKTIDNSDVVFAKNLRNNGKGLYLLKNETYWKTGSFYYEEDRYENMNLFLKTLQTNQINLESEIKKFCQFKVYRVQAQTNEICLSYDFVEYEDGDLYAVGSVYGELLKEYIKHTFVASRSKIVEYLRRYEPSVFEYLVKKDVVSDNFQSDFLLLELIDEQVVPKLKVSLDPTRVERANKRACHQKNPKMDDFRKFYAEMITSEQTNIIPKWNKLNCVKFYFEKSASINYKIFFKK